MEIGHLEELMLDALPIGVFLLDKDAVICKWNKWLAQKTNISAKKAIGQKLYELFPSISSQRFSFALEQVVVHQHPQILSQILNMYLIPIVTSKVAQDQNTQYMQQSVSLFPVQYKEKNYAVIVILDVTESYQQRHTLMQVAKRFEEESVHDELTKLYNRRFLWEFLETAMAEASRKNSLIACTLLDLDYFKKVNDELGHKAGDEMLKSFADLLKENLRASDKVFRYGGEEFIVISTDVDLEKIGELPERIRKAFESQKMHGHIKRHMTCSAGYAVIAPDSSMDQGAAEELVKNADQALYEAKETGRNKVCAHASVEELRHSRFKSELVDFKHTLLVAGNTEMQKTLYAIFLEEVADSEQQVNQALQKKELKQISALMHKLKTSASALGAKRLSEQALLLEKIAKQGLLKEAREQSETFIDTLQQTISRIKSHFKL